MKIELNLKGKSELEMLELSNILYGNYFIDNREHDRIWEEYARENEIKEDLSRLEKYRPLVNEYYKLYLEGDFEDEVVDVMVTKCLRQIENLFMSIERPSDLQTKTNNKINIRKHMESVGIVHNKSILLAEMILKLEGIYF